MKRNNKLSETEFEVLKSFFPEGQEITLKIIMNRSKLSYEPVYRTLKHLEEKHLVNIKKIGRTLVYSLEFKRDLVKMAFILYANERKIIFSEKHLVLSKKLSEIQEETIDFLSVFGSYAKGNETKNSDIDIICVDSNKNKIENKLKALRYETNFESAPVVISKKEFSKIKKENLHFWEDLVNYGIIFKGYELFYYLAYLR